ncbi:MAG: 30S ribosomal protein S17 [Gammaproteobacteria bacterium]
MSQIKKRARTLSGEVISTAMKDTIVVSITRRERHSRYDKYQKRTTKLHVHAPENSSQKGDLVLITEGRPVSKTKSWVLLKILEKAA